MSKKENKFDPPVGYMVGIQHHMVMVERLAAVMHDQTDTSFAFGDAVALAKLLEEAGFRLEPDLFDISADTWKVMDLEIKKRKLQPVPTMADVAESVTELDEEEAEAKQ
jgi:hypothetical protein